MNPVLKPLLSAALTLLAAAGTAHAQCSIQRANVPDFDQRRSALPAQGGMYCVPTSAVNWMAYISNHGWPLMMLQSGPVNWQAQSRFNFVTDQIALMGTLMNTSATNGTNGAGGSSGLQAFMFSRSFGYFTVTRFSGEISPSFLYTQMLFGNLVNVCYGFYEPTAANPNRYRRNGGHCVTLNGVFNACTNSASIRYRDPATDSTLSTQSAFSSFTTRVSRQTFANQDGVSTARWRLLDVGVGSTTRRYLDTAYVITPFIALTASATRSNEVLTLRPIRFPGSELPEVSGAPIPNDTPITGLTMHPAGLDAIVVSSTSIPLPTNFVWRYNLASQQFEQLFTCRGSADPVFSRFGEAYTVCTGAIRRFTLPAAGGWEPVNSVTPGMIINALAYDDTRDELVAVSRTSGRLLRYVHTLDGVIDEPLPTALSVLTGEISIAINEPDQTYFIASADAPTIFEVGLFPGTNRLVLVSQFTLPAVQNPRGLQVNDLGHLHVLGDGSVREFVRTAVAGWQPVLNGPLAGFEGAGVLAVARSRSDFRAGIDDTEEWRDVLINENNPELPDCAADWITDGTINSTDISGYITDWLRSLQTGGLRADFNNDGVVNSTDISAFITAWLNDVTNGCY